MARPRKPAETLKMSGEYREDRHGDRLTAAEMPDGEPVMPDHYDGHAARCWRSIVDGLPAGILRGIDQTLMEQCCEWFAAYHAWDEPKDKGLAADRYYRAASALGIGPANRAKLPKPAKSTGVDVAAKHFRAS